MFWYLKTDVKSVYSYGKLLHFKKLIVLQFIVMEYQSLQNVNIPVYYCPDKHIPLLIILQAEANILHTYPSVRFDV